MIPKIQDTARIALAEYSTCDISDALLKLGIHRGGFLPGISLWSPHRHTNDTKLIGPAYTVKFVRNSQTDAPKLEQHYIDTVPSEAVIFISAPSDIPHAVYGGLMSHRAQYLGAVGTVVDGNFRDLDEQKSLGFPVFARNVATPPFYEVARSSEINVPVTLNDEQATFTIHPGDCIVGDLNGVVCIPQTLMGEVLDLVPQLVEADKKVAEDIDGGATFAAATKQHRKV